MFAKKKFKEFIIKPFSVFIARLLMCQLGKNHLKKFKRNQFLKQSNLILIANFKYYFLISSK